MENVKLDQPLPFLDVTATVVEFKVQYPSGWCYWQLQTESGKALKDGNYYFPKDVLSRWTESDDVLVNDLKAAAPWLIGGQTLI